jgi:hypothetical protein
MSLTSIDLRTCPGWKPSRYAVVPPPILDLFFPNGVCAASAGGAEHA